MKVTLYTDGAARGNPDGPGGYGEVLQFIDKNGTLHEKELYAGYVRITSKSFLAAMCGQPIIGWNLWQRSWDLKR